MVGAGVNVDRCQCRVYGLRRRVGEAQVERVARYACPMPPPTNEQRWDAVKELYRLLRNTENNDKAAQAAKDLQ